MTDPIKILLVEDNDDVAVLFALAMRNEQRARVVAHLQDGEKAVAYLSGKHCYADRGKHPYPDVTLLDLNMPCLNGFEVLEWLRTQSQRPDVIVFTSSERDSDRARCLELGADDFLVKPLDIPGLKALISNLVMRTREKADRTDRN